jgi:hypothetical protein
MAPCSFSQERLVNEKVEHVKNAKQTRDHHCHWPGCQKQVKPAMWGCYHHWMKLPANLRNLIWATYNPGQEEGVADVTRAYLDAAHKVQEWIKSQQAK